jgi:prolyl oligopeptidase
MKNANCLKLVLVTGASFAIAIAEPVSVAQEVTVRPPPATMRPVIDDYFGTSVSDSYRWMEDSKSAELDQWMRQQNEYARNVLGRIRVRSELLRRIDALSEQGPDARRMHMAQGQLFYLKRGAGDSAFKLIVRDRRGHERILVDPEQRTSHETHYSIDFFKSSPDGRYVAYGMSAGGSEDSVIHVVEAGSGKELPDVIDRAGGNRGMIQTIVWHPNSKAFFYNRGRARTAGMSRADFQLRTRAYMHVLATDPSGDPALLGFGISPSLPFTDIDSPHIYAAPGSPYAVGLIYHGVRSEITLYTVRLDQIRGADTPWRKVIDVDDAVTHFAIKDRRVYLLTHKDASRSKVIVVPLLNGTAVDAKVVVPPSEAVLQRIAVAKDALYIRALDGGIGRVKRLDFASTKFSDVPLPFDGSVQEIVTDPKRSGVVFKTEGWTQSSRFLQYFPETGTVKNTGAIPPATADLSEVDAVEVKAKAADGTAIPLSIIFKRGLTRDGTAPTLLMGYGAYGSTEDPTFNATNLAWLERGGILAVAHVRGGGEYGEDWHRAGMKLTKANTIGDFIACAEYLIAQGYTSPRRLAGAGWSAGGITIGGALTRRPDLFAASIVGVGVSDNLRAETMIGGRENVEEFGSVKTKEGFDGLFAMSAYHHVVDGTAYPAVMLTTGVNDARVAPWQSAKMTARLQAATASQRPILLRVDYDSGHGAGATRAQRNAERADQYAFLLWQMGLSEIEKLP